MFYWLVAGADDEERARYGLLAAPEQYVYLAMSDCYTIAGEDPASAWAELKVWLGLGGGVVPGTVACVCVLSWPFTAARSSFCLPRCT